MTSLLQYTAVDQLPVSRLSAGVFLEASVYLLAVEESSQGQQMSTTTHETMKVRDLG